MRHAFHNGASPNPRCRPTLERSLLSPLEMSLMPRRPGLGEVSDSFVDEPRGDRPAAYFARCAWGTDFDTGSGAADARDAAPGVPAAEGLSDRWAEQ